MPHYYQLKWMLLGLLLSVITATVLGTPHTIEEPILYQKIFFNLLIGGAIWGLILLVILRFDARMPWESVHKPKRWLWQILFSLPGAVLIDWLGVQIRNELLGAEYIPHIFWYTDFPVLVLLMLLVQYLFQQAYLKNQLRKGPKATPPLQPTADQHPPTFAAQLSLKKGQKTYQIVVAEIAYLYRRDQINFLRQIDGQEWIWDQSLSALESQLDPQAFFRVNRQLLLHRQALHSYEVLPNRKTQIQLNPPLEEPALLNKNRHAQFKQWLAS
ncbi:MAG: LytTR family transcriptional regulator DNA-binding domain-containing protein [Bacteroidota bacterium]